MIDLDSPSLLHGRVAATAVDKDAASTSNSNSTSTPTLPLSSPQRDPNMLPSRMHRDSDSKPRDIAPPLRPPPVAGAASPRVNRGVTNTAAAAARRESAPRDDEATTTTTTTKTAQAPPHPSHPPAHHPTRRPTEAHHHHHHEPSSSHRPFLPGSSNNSQDTTTTTTTTSSTHDFDRVFTPPVSEGGMSVLNGHDRDSSQESQLLQLSQLAAAQERIPDPDADPAAIGAVQTKRMADGVVKHTRNRSSASPVRNGAYHGHSRNPSAVSVASTTGSRIGELSAELKARLSYAMVKVNNGWQSHNIDQVETLASQATSPTSSSSTVHLRTGSSGSPQLSLRSSNNSTPAMGLNHHFGGSSWRGSPQTHSRGSPTSPVKPVLGLAPPVSIEPSRHIAHPRRNSAARHAPSYLSHSAQASPNVIIPHTPGQPSPYVGTPRSASRTPMVDPILFSPHQNVREQDAIESLLFMSSPGNPANLKHNFPSSSQPLPSSNRPSSQRTALPNSQPRKSLPNGRPGHGHSHSLSQPTKRVGFSERSPNEMDLDEPYGTPNGRTPKRKVNGQGHGQGHHGHAHYENQPPTPRLKQLPTSAGLTAPSRPRPVLREEDIDRMLDRADDSSDSDGEIHIPVSRARREGAHIGA